MEKNIDQILGEIEKIKQQEKLFIVEGIKDKLSLENLGISKIFVLNNGKSFKRNIEIISGMAKNVVILTDFDKEGEQLHDKLKQEFSQIGIRVDEKLRKFIEKDISHIQGFASFIENNF